MPYSFLHIAALRNDVVKAQQLIDGEAPDDVHVWPKMPLEMRDRNLDPIFVDERDSNGWTPLMIAATHGHLAMCRTLLEREADISLKKNFKCTALHLAAHGGHTEVVEYLIHCKADVMAEKLDKSTPLHDAAAGGHVETAQVLLATMEKSMERALVLTLINDSGRTPLHVASKRGHPDMVRWLVASGAATSNKDRDGKTPFDLALDRRTVIAFPGHVDPVDVSVQQVGVMHMELRDMKKLQLDDKGMIVSPPRRGKSQKEVNGRPQTSDVGNFSKSLGILHDGIREKDLSQDPEL